MKSISTINRELNQKIENTSPDELGKYLHAAEMNICNQIASGAWREEEADAELERIRQEVKDASDSLSIYQYLQFRESYNDAAITALGLSYFQDLIRLYDCIESLLRVLIMKSQNLHEDESRSEGWRELMLQYQQKREEVSSCKFWQEHHSDAAEVQG